MPGKNLFLEEEAQGRDLFAREPDAAEGDSVEFKVGDMVGNIPSSAAQYIQDIFAPLINPIDTVSGIANVAIGGIEKLIPGKQEKEVYADAVVDAIKNRYGSVDAFKRTLMRDPVGVLGDLSALVSTGSGFASRVGGRTAQIAAKVGKVASAASPANALIKAPAKAVMNLPGVKGMPEALYKSAAKLGTTLSPTERKAMTKTALENQIMPTVTGVNKARDIIDDYNNKIDSIIDSSGTKKIPRKAMYTHLKALRRELGGVQLDAPESVLKINKVVSKFEKYIKNKDNDYLTAREVQDFKKGIYKSVAYNKRKLKGSRSVEMTKKAIARAAKEQLEKAYPEIKGLNKKEGDMLNLIEAIEKSASRIDNRDIIGIGLPIKVVAGASAGGIPGAIGGMVLGVLDTPTVKANLSLLLKKIQDADVTKLGNIEKTAEVMRQIGRGQREDQSNP